MKKLTKKQMIQEQEYNFPYHYSDLRSDEDRFLNFIEYLNHLKVIRKLLGNFKGKKILDAGCGDGRLCYELKKEKAKVVGIDFSERAIAFARAFNPDVEFLIGDIRNLKLTYKFDSIVLMETLEHIPSKDIFSLFEGLNKILKPDGKLIITVPSINLPLSDKHYQHFTEESLKNTLGSHFKITKIIGYSKEGFKRKVFNNLPKFSKVALF